MPEALRGQAFAALLRTEEAVQRWLSTLLKNINEPSKSGSALENEISNQNLSFMNLSINDASSFQNQNNLLQSQSSSTLPQSTWGK